MKKGNNWLTVLGLAIVIISSTLLVLFEINLSDSIKTLTYQPRTITYTDKQLWSMTLRQKVTSLLILHTAGSRTAGLSQFLDAYQPGGLIFMSDNIGSMTVDDLGLITRQLQINPGLPYLFAIDEEGGVVKRLVEDTLPAAYDLKSQPPDITKNTFKQRAQLLKSAGINLNFGIVADITNDTYSFIYPRVFGGDPTEAGQRVAAAVEGESGTVLSTLKHFPGHGETNYDSHFTIPSADVSFNQWQGMDQQPFVSGINAGAEFVMFGHLTYSSVDPRPASLSKVWHDIIRRQNGFKGICITDDMLMLQQSGIQEYADPVRNAVAALNAGNTMLLYASGDDAINLDSLIDGIVSAVNNREIKLHYLEGKVRQVLALRHSLAN